MGVVPCADILILLNYHLFFIIKKLGGGILSFRNMINNNVPMYQRFFNWFLNSQYIFLSRSFIKEIDCFYSEVTINIVKT